MMKFQMLKWNAKSAVVLAIAFLAAGCSQQANEPSGGSVPVSEASHDDQGADDHSDWWCVEHGVPEAECAQCDSSLIAQFKQKGDWCEEHDRPESQCFVCSPKRADKFIARYEAKFGKQPPEPTE